MSELSGVLFVSVMAWLVLGGYAFGQLADDDEFEAKTAGMLMLFSILLAPFAFGFVLYAYPKPKLNNE